MLEVRTKGWTLTEREYGWKGILGGIEWKCKGWEMRKAQQRHHLIGRGRSNKEMESEDGKRDSTAKLGKTPTKKGLRMIIPTVELGENKD